MDKHVIHECIKYLCESVTQFVLFKEVQLFFKYASHEGRWKWIHILNKTFDFRESYAYSIGLAFVIEFFYLVKKNIQNCGIRDLFFD